jgi:hypothetical protein
LRTYAARVQIPSPGLTLVGAEQRLNRWLGIYTIGVFGVICFLAGFVPETILLIAVSEAFLLLWRPKPALGPSAFRPPAPEKWQAPIAALRWLALMGSFRSLAQACLLLGVATIALVIAVPVVVIRAWPYHLGLPNFLVLILLGAWLGSRPFWIAPLRQALKGSAPVQLSQYLTTMSLVPDGVVIDLRPINIGQFRARQQVFSVAFDELDEVRAMDGLAAEGYQLTMEQYDPTLTARVAWELFRFLSGQIPRPTLCVGVVGLGTHVLMRNSTSLYLIGNADQTAPAIVAAWQAWRDAHQTPATTQAT